MCVTSAAAAASKLFRKIANFRNLIHGLLGKNIDSDMRADRNFNILILKRSYTFPIFFLRFKSVEIRIPKVNSFSIVFKTIKRKFKKQSFNSLFDLYFFLARSRLSSRIRVSSLTRKTKKQALTENEAVALYKMSSSLGNHPIKSRFPKAMRRFHLLCLGFIQTVLFNPHKTDSWPNTKPSYGSSRAKGKGFPASRRLQKYSSLNRTNHQRHTKEKHSKGQYWRYGNHDNRLPNQLNSFFCQDMRDGLILQCFGMCGPKCWCWNWICEDCCLHKGCFQHDACCQNFLTTYCLLPFLYGFDCSEGYGGYPRCLI